MEEVLRKIREKAKTVEEIQQIYSEISEEEHKWIHVDKLEALLDDKIIIDREQLQKLFKKYYFSRAMENSLKSLLNELLGLKENET